MIFFISPSRPSFHTDNQADYVHATKAPALADCAWTLIEKFESKRELTRFIKADQFTFAIIPAGLNPVWMK